MGELRGRRLPDGNHDYDLVQPGDYWRPEYGGRQPSEWWFRDPLGAMGRITKHSVEEHEDGTITVRPSILCDRPGQSSYHGWLTRGVWTSA